MKILRILPKSLRKRIMIKELQRFRQTAERKQALKSTKSTITSRLKRIFTTK